MCILRGITRYFFYIISIITFTLSSNPYNLRVNLKTLHRFALKYITHFLFIRKLTAFRTREFAFQLLSNLQRNGVFSLPNVFEYLVLVDCVFRIDGLDSADAVVRQIHPHALRKVFVKDDWLFDCILPN